jgi:hypothetical protein
MQSLDHSSAGNSSNLWWLASKDTRIFNNSKSAKTRRGKKLLHFRDLTVSIFSLSLSFRRIALEHRIIRFHQIVCYNVRCMSAFEENFS